MRFRLLLPLLLVAVLKVKEAAGRGTCRAQNILEACLAMQHKQMRACAYDNWECKCHAQKKVLTCYDNCPESENRTLQEMQVQVYCMAVDGRGYDSDVVDRMTRAPTDSDRSQQAPANDSKKQASPPPPPPPPPAAPQAPPKDDLYDIDGRGNKRSGNRGSSNYSLVDDIGAATDSLARSKSAIEMVLAAGILANAAIAFV
ncbi:hypothetical protein GGI07_005772 [Coemansia sp. Benny D115]|nr:hypothetical protein GGI07_005772 [Coemansia sp. Benny D115]